MSLPQPTPPLWIPAFAGMTRWVAGMTGLAGATETHERDGKHPSRIGVRDMLSHQSSHAGWRRHTKV